MEVSSPAFTDSEKRFVLAEAIKLSHIPVEQLLKLLNDGNITPAWEDMVLPYGRSLKSCKDAFETLRASQALPTTPAFSTTPISSTPNKRKSGDAFQHFMPVSVAKRRQSGAETITPSARDILPKPSNGSPQSMTSVSTTVPKKRGRPSKADVERKQQEAIARGDILPPSLVITRVGEQSHGEAASHGGFAPIAPLIAPAPASTPTHEQIPKNPIVEKELPANPSSDSSGKKKARPKAAPKTAKVSRQPGESSFPINLQAGQPEQSEEPQSSVETSTVQPPPVAGPVGGSNKAHSTYPVILEEQPPPEPAAKSS